MATTGRLFRGANLYLVLAGLLSAAMLLAPIAYSSNYSTGLHATIYGTWAKLDQSMGHGVNFIRTRHLWELPYNIAYAILGVLSFVVCVVVAFSNRNEEHKHTWIGRALMVAFAHLISGILLRYMGAGLVGTSPVSDGLDSGFQREFLFHLFIIYFLWRAWSKQAVALKG